MNSTDFTRIVRRSVGLALCAMLGLWHSATLAALELGQSAPAFSAEAALDGKLSQYVLHEALRQGPVVLYFYPSAFSIGCSIDAREVAEAMAQFESLGATVIGVSRDEITTQKKFSVTACMGKFSVAADPDLAIAKAYDAVLTTRPDYANRTSYVILPNGKILYR